MGTQRLFLATILSGAAALFGQSADGLKWTQEAIDSHASMRHFEPPSRQSETKWKVVKLEGCRAELQQLWHRESPESVFLADGVYTSSEDKTVTYSFDLHDLRPSEVMYDTSTGLPHVKIFTQGDNFHLKTDFVSRAVRPDGSVAETSKWSAPGNARNLWMYFDSPSADNKTVVKRVAAELQNAASHCASGRASGGSHSPKVVVAAALREFHVNSK